MFITKFDPVTWQITSRDCVENIIENINFLHGHAPFHIFFVKHDEAGWSFDSERGLPKPDHCARWSAEQQRWISTVEQAAQMQTRRLAALEKSDYRELPSVRARINSNVVKQWDAYRHALREINHHPAWPWLDEEMWPRPPV